MFKTPAEILKEISKSVTKKNSFSTTRLFVYSVLGGAFISIGGLLALVVTGGMPAMAASNPGLVKLIFGSLFPLGLVMVIIGGAELFTSDCTVISLGVFNRQLSIQRLLKLWAIVYFGNFFGAFIISYLFAYQAGILNADPFHSAAINLGEHKVSGTFLVIFIKGVGANWLVCMALWLSNAAKDVTGKIFALWFPVMGFVTLGFEHSIANMFFIPTSMMLGADISMYSFLVKNLLPATLGNIVGGVLFVTVPYWILFRNDQLKM